MASSVVNLATSQWEDTEKLVTCQISHRLSFTLKMQPVRQMAVIPSRITPIMHHPHHNKASLNVPQQDKLYPSPIPLHRTLPLSDPARHGPQPPTSSRPQPRPSQESTEHCQGLAKPP